MKFLLTIFIYVISISLSFCQNNFVADDVTSLNEIALLEKYNDNIAFDLLYEIDNATQKDQISQQKNAFYKFLDGVKTKANSKKFKKNALLIYRLIHNQYLKKYVDNPNFNDIFNNGDYNCVTATALYAIALDYLSIDYEIREMPTHVYLIVNPKSEKIFYETTTPGLNPYQINARNLQLYKQHLIANKLMTEAEANDESYFEKNWLIDEIIDLKKLVGLQYYNNAIKYFDEEEYEKAALQTEKSGILYEKDYIKEFLYNNVVELLNNNIGNNSSDQLCNYLSKVYDYGKDKDNFGNQFIEYFNYYAKDFLKDDSGINEYKKLHNCLNSSLQDENIIKKFNNEYHSNLAIYNYNATQFDEALHHFEKSYSPDNKDHNLFIINSIIQKYRHYNDTELCLNELNRYQQIFPFINKNLSFKEFKIHNYMKLIYENFENENETNAENYLNQFRKEFPINNGDTYDHQQIAFGYIAAVNYYMFQNNSEKANSLLDEGFAYTPNNIELKRLEKEIVKFEIRRQ